MLSLGENLWNMPRNRTQRSIIDQFIYVYMYAYTCQKFYLIPKIDF